MTGTKACAAGDARVYVGEPPRLTAKVYDEDESARVAAEFEAWWLDAEGVEQRRSMTTYATTPGSGLSWQMPEDVPAQAVVSWHVRANDGQAVSPWSDEGSGAACEFVYDDKSPEKPVVRSEQYPDNDVWTDGVGVYGTFTADSPSDDVVSYIYEFSDGSYKNVPADQLGGPASLKYLPLSAGPKTLSVRSVDRAGRGSLPNTYRFLVSEGRTPTARWNLADEPGARRATALSGPEARVGSGVTFGAPAPRGTDLESTATLDGSGHGFITPDAQVVDSAKTFAVSAWVRPGRTDRAMTVASQDAGEGRAFTLGLRTTTEAPVWSFDFGGARLTGGAPETGEWAHVLGLYDAGTGLAQLYVNGRPVGDGQQAEAAATAGNFQIGRARGKEGYRDRWQGEIAHVRVHDRVVVATEVAEFAYRSFAERGHWQLESASDGRSPELHGGEALKLGEGGSIVHIEACPPDDPFCLPSGEPLEDQGYLELDGTSGYAATELPAVDTDDSFTISAVVRLADTAPERPMTVLSQGGENGNGFRVRYDPAVQQWQLVLTRAGVEETVAIQYAAADGGRGQGREVTVVYDDAADQITLYLDGDRDAGARAQLPKLWTSAGGLQIGRAKAADGWGEHLHGAVDEVRAFAGAVDERWIGSLRWGTEFNQ
ncbi:LamG domain-containing protein [Streptomyces mesophilus]|uniref:LamG domain-containing protein n=1 Tax=Streptomyces mesophilus TaxID=1775132 RepID=UPI00331A66D7